MIVIKYVLFAVLATLVNIFFQWMSFNVYSGIAEIFVAMAVGTIAGLVVKYILDAKWIFYDMPKTPQKGACQFMAYAFTGIFTTIVFWGTEMIFYYFIPFRGSQYVGAVLGLGIGYMMKFFLDKRYVFDSAGGRGA